MGSHYLSHEEKEKKILENLPQNFTITVRTITIEYMLHALHVLWPVLVYTALGGVLLYLILTKS